MYYVMRASAPSLHRESIDSVIEFLASARLSWSSALADRSTNQC